jgi:hypothetical protein
VSHECGKMQQAFAWVDAGAVPTEQGLHRKGVAKAVQAGRSGIWAGTQAQLWQEVMKGLAYSLGPERCFMAIAECEERIIGLPHVIR